MLMLTAEGRHAVRCCKGKCFRCCGNHTTASCRLPLDRCASAWASAHGVDIPDPDYLVGSDRPLSEVATADTDASISDLIIRSDVPGIGQLPERRKVEGIGHKAGHRCKLRHINAESRYGWCEAHRAYVTITKDKRRRPGDVRDEGYYWRCGKAVAIKQADYEYRQLTGMSVR
jgi:hypothetical protein